MGKKTIIWVWFYDGVKGSQLMNSKNKHCYYKGCTKVFSAHNMDKKENHLCDAALSSSSLKSGNGLVKQFTTSYEDHPTPIKALSLLIVDSNSAFTLANSKYVPKLLSSAGAP